MNNQTNLENSMKTKITWLLAGILFSFQALAAPETFEEAKSELKNFVYYDQNHNGSMGTLYCGCEWDWRGRSGGVVDAKECGYQVRKQKIRGDRIEYEHVLSGLSNMLYMIN